jgi:hypothetical protein
VPTDRLRFFLRKTSINFFNEPIRVYEYRPKEFTNFGDALTSDIVRRLFHEKVEVYHSLPSDRKLDLLGVGSIADWDMFQNIPYKIFLWGSGAMYAEDKTGKMLNRNMIFCSVRGEKTRQRLARKYQNIPIGDPGLLANLIYTQSVKQTEKIGIIPHYADENELILKKARLDPNRYKIISVKQRPEKVADDIKSCKAVLSSSLHGLIVADSFGIPNIHIPMADLENRSKGSFKFLDYYSAIGKPYKFMDPKKIYNKKDIDDIIKNYQSIKNLRRIQNNLIKAFPYRKGR